MPKTPISAAAFRVELDALSYAISEFKAGTRAERIAGAMLVREVMTRIRGYSLMRLPQPTVFTFLDLMAEAREALASAGADDGMIENYLGKSE